MLRASCVSIKAFFFFFCGAILSRTLLCEFFSPVLSLHLFGFLKGFSHSSVDLLWMIRRMSMKNTCLMACSTLIVWRLWLVTHNSGFWGLLMRNWTRSPKVSHDISEWASWNKMMVSSHCGGGGKSKCKNRMYQVRYFVITNYCLRRGEDFCLEYCGSVELKSIKRGTN